MPSAPALQMDLFDKPSDPMNLIDKLLSIPVDNKSRLSPEDLAYCQEKERDKEQSLNYLEQLRQYIEKLKSENPSLYVNCELNHIQGRKDECNSHFVAGLLDYFRTKYNVTMDQDLILKNFDLNTISFNQIVDAIFEMLGGLTFSEKSAQEIKDKCKAELFHRREAIEIHGSRLVFHGLLYWTPSYSGCKQLNLHYNSRERLEKIFESLAHFDSGIASIKRPLENFEGYSSWQCHNGFFKIKHVLNLRKALSIRFYKNGKTEIIFKNYESAVVFAVEYCGFQPK